jgi:hypothetical protein
VELNQSDVAQEECDQEPVPDHKLVLELEVNFEQYDWLFTTAMANHVESVDAGQRRYLQVMDKYWQAADHYRQECEMRDV